MKKIISILFGASLLVATSAQSAGMVGIKIGQGELNGENDAYTAGDTNIAAQSADVSNEYGAIFAEIGLGDSPISVGVEYVPFEADIRLDKGESSSGANVSDATTLYALFGKEAGVGSVYVKAGYFMADVKTVQDGQTTINSSDDTLEGPMVGIGFQSEANSIGLIFRGELTYTELDSVSITTTSNGSANVKKTGDGDITTFSVGVAKSF